MENQTPETGQTVPIFEAKTIGQKYGHSQVIVVAWDDQTQTTSITTWGKSAKQSEQAAKGGNAVKQSFKWPEEECQAKSNRPSLQTEAEFLASLHFQEGSDGFKRCQFQHGELDYIMVTKLDNGQHYYQVVNSVSSKFGSRDYASFCRYIDDINSMNYEEYCKLFRSSEADKPN